MPEKEKNTGTEPALSLISLITQRINCEVNPFRNNDILASVSSNMSVIDVLQSNDDPAEFFAFIRAKLLMVPEEKKGSQEKADHLASISVVFMLTYSSSSPDQDPALAAEFILNTAQDIAWPYWCEVVVTQTQRMGLGTFTLPIQRPAPDKD